MSIDQFDENSYEQALIALFKEMGYQYECGYDVDMRSSAGFKIRH